MPDEAQEDVMARIAELEALARDMLSRFARTSDGHRARVGQVQIARWEKQLGGGGGD
jgi:hypothetical protein